MKTEIMNYPQELEIETAELWVETGAIQPTRYDDENTYYVNEFDMEFYCKNYPANANYGIPE